MLVEPTALTPRSLRTHFITTRTIRMQAAKLNVKLATSLKSVGVQIPSSHVSISALISTLKAVLWWIYIMFNMSFRKDKTCCFLYHLYNHKFESYQKVLIYTLSERGSVKTIFLTKCDIENWKKNLYCVASPQPMNFLTVLSCINIHSYLLFDHFG